MNRVQTLTICKERYKETYEFESAIQEAVLLLLKAGYIMVIRYDEPGLGIVCIDYESVDGELGVPHPVWLTEDQHMDLLAMERGDDDVCGEQ